MKRYSIVFIMFAVGFLLCQSAFADIISVNPKPLFIELNHTEIVTVDVMNDWRFPLNNITVVATSSDETAVKVMPSQGLTNSNGQVFFTVSSMSNGTATISFNTNSLSESIYVNVASNIAPCATASSNGGGINEFGPEKMNDNVGKEDCSYHWIKNRNGIRQKKQGWIMLTWKENVTIDRIIIQTANCGGSCGKDTEDPFYIDAGRNIGSGVVQYLDKDEVTWVKDGEFIEEVGDVKYSFTKQITTKSIRISGVLPNPQCKGQQSNPVIFEWKVFGTSSCK